jgi:hypothetical protein
MISSITDLRNATAQHVVGLETQRSNPNIVASIWNKLLHDRRMPRNRMTRKRGGAAYELAGAPLQYAMTPGSAFTTDPAVAVYDRFPVDPTVNPQVVSDLDVYFNSALSRGCGVENTSLEVPANMGSNLVGGKRKRKGTRKHGGASVDPTGFFDNIQTRVGDLASGLVHHPYMSDARPTIPHSLAHQWQGRVDSIPSSPDPTNPTWSYMTEQPQRVADSSVLMTNLGPSVGNLYNSTNFGPSVGGKSRKGRKARKTHRKTHKARKSHRKTRGRK